MKITVWSDFVCPFCYIGATHLEKALENFEHSDEVEIEYKSYQLEPGAKYEPEKTFRQAMMDRKGMSGDQIDQINGQVADMAEQAGLDFNFDKMKLTDTFPAHRVFQYAKEQGLGNEFYDKLYKAYFTDGELISENEVITRVANEIGLDEKQVQDILEDTQTNEAKVKQDINEAGAVGVQGVPFFVFNDKYAIPGAQPVDVFEQALTQIHDEMN